MRRFEDTISISAPAGRVFDYVADFTRHGEWAGNGLEVMKSSDGPVAVGSTFSTTAKQFGTQREHSTITELTPGKAFAWDSVGALGSAHHSFALAEDGGATKLTKTAQIVEPTTLAKMTSWKLSRDIPKGLHSDLANIKARVEWSGNGLQVTKSTEGPVAVGSSFSTTAKQFGTQREQSIITELSAGSAFAWESTGGARPRTSSVLTRRRRRVDDAVQECRDRRADLLGEAHELEALEGRPEGPSQRPRQHQGPPGRARRGLIGDPAHIDWPICWLSSR